MNIKNQSPLWKIVLIIVLAFLVVSCQPTTSSTQITDNNEIQDIRVQVTEPTKITSKFEEFPLPNCGGSDKLAQSLGTLVSVSKSATVGTKATVTGGGEVAVPEMAKLKLEIQVELAYQQTFESANSRLDTIIMSAAAGTHVIYTIAWEEQTFNSIVQYSSDGKVYEVPYTYKLSVPKIDKSSNVICPGNGTGNNGSGNTTATQPTSAPSVQSSNDARDVAAQTLGYTNLDDFMSAFGIPTEIKSRIFVCPNEATWCLGVYEEPGQADFHFKNITNCTIDGKQANGTSTIPSGFDGMVKGFTVRPCSR